jgi:hypothetical protein
MPQPSQIRPSASVAVSGSAVAGDDGRRLGRLALGGIAGALGLILVTAVAGPSAAVVPLPPGWFPVSANLRPSPWLVWGLLAAAVVLSVAATATAWAALRRGWAPSPGRLLAGGLLAVALLAIAAPVAGADVLSYAAYGRIAGRGMDAYSVRPDSLPADPFARAVEDPWRSTPSVYGPLATAEQSLVVRAAGGSVRTAVVLLDFVNGIAFGGAACLLFLLAGDDEGRRRRAVLAFGLNPVLLFVVVGGGHLDALVALAVVAALALWRRSPLWSGLVGGAGVLIKLTAGLPLAGWAWLAGWSRRWTRAARLLAGAGLIAAGGYAVVGLHALNQARRASSFVSVGTPWRPIRWALQAVVGHHTASLALSVGAAALTAGLAARLARSLPAEDGDVARAARAGLVLALAWTLAAPYVLAWYDAVPWALLALLPRSRYHKILLAHTGMLALAYLPGRVVALPDGLAGLTTGLRSGVTPLVLAALVVAALWPNPARRSNPSGRGG